MTIADLSKENIMYLLEMAQEFEKHPNRGAVEGKGRSDPFLRAFYSYPAQLPDSSQSPWRHVSSASLMPRLPAPPRAKRSKDTILMVSNYADVIAMRHFIEGAAQYASEVAPVPIVNAGDGAHMHPSQCLLDLYSIFKTRELGELEHLSCG